MDPIRVREVERRLAAGSGGYEIVHRSPGMEVGVYVVVARSRTDSSRTIATSSTSSSTVAVRSSSRAT